MSMPKTVDSYRFISGITKRMIRSWISQERPRPDTMDTACQAPFRVHCGPAQLGRNVAQNRHALRPGRRAPQSLVGRPVLSRIPNGTTERDVKLYHLHIDPEYAERDLNCLFPIQRLRDLARAGEIGAVRARHYSMMGYPLRPDRLLSESVPAIIQNLREDRVKRRAVLVPA